ncbi:hypothetical protein LTR04_002556, partial [Oleoguttula sp. CCFEE 6159]
AHVNAPGNACGPENDYALGSAYLLEDTGSSENDFVFGNFQALGDAYVPENDSELEKLFVELGELNQSWTTGSENN